MAQLQPYCAIEGNDDGLPVVFVHGMGVDHRSLMMLDKAFDGNDSIRRIYLDLPGFGLSLIHISLRRQHRPPDQSPAHPQRRVPRTHRQSTEGLTMLPSVGKQITWLPSPRGAVTKGD